MNAVVLSIDAELGWGFHDQPERPDDRIEASRDAWRTLLECCSEFDVPATWSVVGHLLLSECQGVHERHPLGPTWFDHERGCWADRPDLRFGRDLIEATLAADVEHELGFQTFSHVEFGDEHVSSELARAECAHFFDALEAAADDGLPTGERSLASATFPRNAVGHRDVLAEWGFECYRGAPPREESRGGLRGAVRTLARATVSAPPVVEPIVDDYGLVNVPPSLALFGDEDARSDRWPSFGADPVVRAARRGVDRVAAEDGVLHLWLHPHDLVDDAAEQRVRDVLAYVAERRDAGDVEVRTLGEVADAVQPTIATDAPEVTP